MANDEAVYCFGLWLKPEDFESLGEALQRITNAERAAWAAMGKPF